MAKKQRKTDKPGPIEGLAGEIFDVKSDERFGCLGVPYIYERVQAADKVLGLAAQLVKGAKNRVRGVCFDAGKYAMISKPKLNELKRALRKVGVKM
ncbi:MAG: hypothetical protein DRP65_00525 [Planctomycetota bacterium]|nr:MAG: hypothetical protein DRP65_00525 [Planctomycetota bacterium]